MILIIEGVDGAGKTTLATQLSAQTKYPIIHMSAPKTEQERADMMDYYTHLMQSEKNAILDRCWYSEMVYGSIMREAPCIDFKQMYALELLVAKKGGMIMHCTGQADDLWKRCLKRGEDYVTDKDTFDLIHRGFKELFSVPHYLPIVTYTCPIMHA